MNRIVEEMADRHGSTCKATEQEMVGIVTVI
jgi:hypothetical protein